MQREKEEVAELVMKIFDRLESQFDGAKVLDALLLVEIDTGEIVTMDEDTSYQRSYTPTVCMLESTDDRLTVQIGIIDFCRDVLLSAGRIDNEDDEEDEDASSE